MRILKAFFALIALAIIGILVWLWVAPPELIRVGTNYAAKIVCSNVFIAGRNAEEVLADDVQAPGHPVLKFISVQSDESQGRIDARFLGFFAPATSIHRSGVGCTTLLDQAAVPLALSAPADIPAAEKLPTQINAELQSIIEKDDLAGPGMRAILVLKNGTVVAERYAEGFDAGTPLLGWSMTKTITAALVGRLEQARILSRKDANLFPSWSGDERAKIKLEDLLGMSSDLTWNEGYGSVSDVTRLLYLEPDMAAFGMKAGLDTPDGSQIGKKWNYSSGTTVMISKYIHDKVGPEAVNLPRKVLFQPLGMDSAMIEVDSAGTLVGGSYMYATARDWARFGQFLLQDGTWAGEKLLPDGFVSWMKETHPASEGRYGRGHIWREPPRKKEFRGEPIPETLKDTAWLSGHDGQSVAIDDESGLVIVRLGLTPSKLGYRPENLAIALKEALAN